MTTEIRCEDIICNILYQGGILIYDKKNETKNLLARNVIINKDNCKIKIGYINIGNKQICVQKVCSCYDLSWISIPNDCFNKRFL